MNSRSPSRELFPEWRIRTSTVDDPGFPCTRALGLTLLAVLLLASPSRADQQGFLDGLDTRAPAPVLEITPDGTSIVYHQGLPWPRLVARKIEPADAPVVALSPHAPFGSRRPRFTLRGDHVLFTVDPGWKPRRRGEPASPRTITPRVARAALDGSGSELVSLSSTLASRPSAVLLDVEPTTGTLLLGVGPALSSEVAHSGEFSLEVVELDSTASTLREMGFSIHARDGIRYSSDGTRILFAVLEAGRSSRLRFQDRATGTVQEFDLHASRLGWRSHSLEVRPDWGPHLGSAAGSPRTVWTTRDSSLPSPGVVPFPGAPATWRGGPPVPVSSSRKGLLLFRAADPEWPAWWVAPPTALEISTKIPPLEARSRLVPLARFLPGSMEWKERLLASFPPLEADAPPVRHRRARLKRTRFVGEEAPVRETITILETVTGKARIEISTPAENPGDAPSLERSTHDGREWFRVDDAGTRSLLELEEFERVRGSVSPFGLLTDPAGLLLDQTFSPGKTDDRLRFAGTEGTGGEVRLVEREGAWLPSEIHVSGTGPDLREGAATIRLSDYVLDGRRWRPRLLEVEREGERVRLEVGIFEVNPEIEDELLEP